MDGKYKNIMIKTLKILCADDLRQK